MYGLCLSLCTWNSDPNSCEKISDGCRSGRLGLYNVQKWRGKECRLEKFHVSTTASQIILIMSISFYGLLHFFFGFHIFIAAACQYRNMKYRSNPKTLKFVRMATLVITHKPSQLSKKHFHDIFLLLRKIQKAGTIWHALILALPQQPY